MVEARARQQSMLWIERQPKNSTGMSFKLQYQLRCERIPDPCKWFQQPLQFMSSIHTTNAASAATLPIFVSSEADSTLSSDCRVSTFITISEWAFKAHTV